MRVVLALLLPIALAPAVNAQSRPTTLRVTVVDPTGAVLPNAAVQLTPDATTRAAEAKATANQDGVATFTGLVPGRYTIEAAFPGFETRQVREVRVRVGENTQVVLLPLQKLETSVDVSVDRQQAASDRNQAFGTTLTRDQVDALSDDPAQLQQQLQNMAGPGAVMRVDSFEGAAPPPKAMIKSIRISRDQFAAEYHAAGGVAIDIVTQPGIGPKRYFTSF